MGDFNLPDINWNTLSSTSQLSNVFCDLVFKLNLSQLVDMPTHNQGNILDLIFTNDEELFHTITVHPHEAFPLCSDHYPITFDISHGASLPKQFNTCQYVYDYTKANYEGLNSCILDSNISHCFNSQNIGTVWTIIKTAVFKAMSANIPKFRLRAHQYPKWFSPELRHELKCLHTLRKKFKHSPTPHNLDRLNHAEAQFQLNIDSTKSNYEANLIHSFAYHNNSKIYEYIRSIAKTKNIPTLLYLNSSIATTDADKALLYNEYFYSVYANSSSTLPDMNTITSDVEPLQSFDISEFDVYNALINLDPNKAQGIDGIGPKFLKYCAESLVQPLCHLFNLSLSSSVIPILNGKFIELFLYSNQAIDH